jgi:hypothetical protein
MAVTRLHCVCAKLYFAAVFAAVHVGFLVLALSYVSGVRRLVHTVDLSVSDDMVIYSVCMKFNNTKGLITKL